MPNLHICSRWSYSQEGEQEVHNRPWAIAVIKPIQAHSSRPFIKTQSKFLGVVFHGFGLCLWFQSLSHPFIFHEKWPVFATKQLLSLLPACKRLGSKGLFMFCTISVPFSPTRYNFLRNFMGLLHSNLYSTPLDNTHTHESLQHKSFSTLGSL